MAGNCLRRYRQRRTVASLLNLLCISSCAYGDDDGGGDVVTNKCNVSSTTTAPANTGPTVQCFASHALALWPLPPLSPPSLTSCLNSKPEHSSFHCLLLIRFQSLCRHLCVALDAHSAVLRCELGAFSHALFFTFVWPWSTFFFLSSFIPIACGCGIRSGRQQECVLHIRQ